MANQWEEAERRQAQRDHPDQYRSFENESARVKKGNAQGPYRGGLMQNFGQFDLSNSGDLGRISAYGADSDSDVRNAEAAYYHMMNGDSGTSHDDQSSLYNMYRGRIGTKNALAEQIEGAPSQLNEQESLLKLQAGSALGEGLRNTRESYNRRGLLYSGMREGAEQKKKGQVAGALSSGLVGAKRESQNAVSAAQNAYAQVGLENAQESLQLAHQAFDTASMNNIARMQAMQQLGGAVGSAAGMFAGSYRGGQGSPGGPGHGDGRDYTATPGGGNSQLMQGAY